MYLEGMEEASIFVHVAVHDITGKVGIIMKISLKQVILFMWIPPRIGDF